jgi:hypothetical protein
MIPESVRRTRSRAQDRAIGRVAEDPLKDLLVLCDCADLRYGGIHAGLAHFIRIDNWQCCLLLEGFDPAVPELALVVERVQNGWFVALAHAAVDTD